MERFIEKFPIVTAVVLLLVVTGCVDVLLDGELSEGFRQLLGALDMPLAGLAIGRGVQATRKVTR
jgi:hypothetical protein